MDHLVNHLVAGRLDGQLGAAGGHRFGVLLQVSVQVCLLSETTIAQATLEGALLVMDVAHVALQVGRYTERAIAVTALVGLFARMGAQVAS